MHSVVKGQDIPCGSGMVPIRIIGELQQDVPALLYFHGNNTSVEKQISLCGALHAHSGLCVVLPEYSGHGDNTAKQYADTTTADHANEALAAFDWLNGVTHRIAVYGGSYGAHMAACVMSTRCPSFVVVQAPTLVFPEDWHIRWGLLDGYDKRLNASSLDELRQVIALVAGPYTGPLLVMESENDELVQPHVVRAWREVFPLAEYDVIPGALHSLRQSNDDARRYWVDTVGGFLRQL